MASPSPSPATLPYDIRLTDYPLDVNAAVEAVTTPESGAINLFLGITRAEIHPDRGNLLALEYHAYPEMAMSELHKLAARAAAQWPIQRLALWHRLGAVSVGAPSVIVAVSCSHRAEAFAACQFLIDELKKSVPLWKKELYTRQARWQGEPSPPPSPP